MLLKDEEDQDSAGDDHGVAHLVAAQPAMAHARQGEAARISAREFYGTYHGHRVDLLDAVHCSLRRTHNSVVWLAGDSSLDNKYWFSNNAAPLNGYQDILQGRMVKDVCYHLNNEMVQRAPSMCCINTAVEATTLNSRSFCLLAQDKFIHDNIGPDDTLVVSVGGNDIALQPLPCTVCNISALVCCTPLWCLRNCSCACPPNLRVDLGCVCCGLFPGCVTGVCGCPPGLGYMVDMFKNRVGNYVRRILGKRRPRKVLICMIYYPDTAITGSWADMPLSLLGYNRNPARLQTAIQKVFELGTSKIRIKGTQVIPFRLFDVLDGTDTDDYEQRVEPSDVGGAKMAAALMDAILA